MNKQLVIFTIAVVMVGGGAFYGGMYYTKKVVSGQNVSAENGFTGGQNFRNLSPEERQQRIRERGMTNGTMQGLMNRGDGFISGEIISKDSASFVVKLRDSGSSIVLFSSSTRIITSANGTAEDLKESARASINGTKNPDGSITAEIIQIHSEEF